MTPRSRRRVAWGLSAAVIGAVVVFVVTGLDAGDGQRALARRYIRDWSAGRYAAMYALLSPSSRAAISPSAFHHAYADAAETATETTLKVTGRIRLSNGTASVPVAVMTRTFGVLEERATIPLSANGTSVRYAPSMVFPGLRPGERLRRDSTLGRRGSLLTADGALLAAGTSLDSSVPADVAGEVVGTLGPIPALEHASYMALGYPAGAQVGQDGLEQVFQRQLAGRPGGILRAGRRVLARRTAIAGHDVRTTVDPNLEADAISSLSGSFLGGMVVLNERTGAILAAAGQAFTNLQPPGSTFKIITSTAALQYGVARIDTRYPMLSQTSVGGFLMQNAAGEVCGGTLINAFATSCDTTYAPLGIQIGPRRLLATARRYGFDAPVAGIPIALASSVPSSLLTAGANAVGSAAIGQWQVLATPLVMADAAAAVANDGERALPTFSATDRPRYVRVTTPTVAHEVEQMMVAVTTYPDGTGYGIANIPGYTVAGKTGTAELASTANQANDAKETDAWFVGFIPHATVPVVVCAIFPEDGYGATAAAPAVKQLLEDSLGID